MEDNAFNISVLASGSTGNSLYIETDKKKVLVDAGLSGKKITELMTSIGRDPADLDAIFVTHEHTDHIHGVGVLARRYGMDIYANERTWQAMAPAIGKVKLEQQYLFEEGTTLTFGDMDIESFGVSHDAVEPQFYQFHRNGKSFVVLTDTGYCSDRIRGIIKNANGYLMESNHDLNMLRMGSYPWSVQQRILGDQGHLSNEDGALVLTDVIGNKTERIYLGHLSKENNMKDLARLTMKNVLTEHDLAVGHDFKLFDTDPERATDLFSI